MADPFQSIFNENFVRTNDGRYFLPFSKTHLGQQQMQQDVDESGTPFGEKYYRSGYDPESGFQRYSSLEDYFNATNPGSAGVLGPGAQNGLGINTQGMSAEQIAALRGKYKDELGYYVDPSRIVGTHPATTAGMKPNEGGLWQLLSLLLPAVGGIAGAAGEAGAAGSDAAAVGGSEGSTSLTGGAGLDTVAPSSSVGEQVGSGAAQGAGTQAGSTLGSGLETVGSAAAPAAATAAANAAPSGTAAATGGLTAAEIAQLTPAALAAYNAFTGSSNGGNSTANNAAGNAAQISNDQWNYYKTQYQPLESNLIGQAQAAGSPEEFARARGVANADVTGAFDTARKNTLNRMQSYGINPGSPAFQSTAASTDLAEGATKAGALTAADNNTRNLAYSKALDVVGLGKGIPAQSAASSAAAANAATAASKEKFAQNTDNLKNAGYGLNTVSNVASKWFGNETAPSANYTGSMIASPTSYGSTYSTTEPAYGASGGKVSPSSIGYAEGGAVIDAERTGPGQYDATALKGVLQKRGLSDVVAHAESSKAAMRHKGAITPHMRRFAVGGGVGRQGLEGPDASNMGQLQGPGTETSDSIPATIDGEQPAALSTGEVVMNAAVPKLSGGEILAALNEAGLKKRGQGIEPQTSADVPPNAGMQAYRSGGPVMRYGLGA